MNSYLADISNQMVYLQDPTMSKKIFMGEFTLQQVTYSFEPPDENVVAIIDSDLDAREPTCTTWLCPKTN